MVNNQVAVKISSSEPDTEPQNQSSRLRRLSGISASSFINEYFPNGLEAWGGQFLIFRKAGRFL